MSTCHNCGHAGTFVLLAQFALAVRDDSSRPDSAGRSGPTHPDAEPAGASNPSDCSLAVQCPVCDSTDVGVTAADLLARHGSSTTS